jgi:RNA polymerase sigma-70 factor (ECF subfamily)
VIATADTGALVDADYDSQLMTRIESGNVDAFDELYDRYSARAYRVAWCVCHEDGGAEDAVQETFVSIWRGPTGYQSARGTVAAWLLTTVRYRAIDIDRRNHRHVDRRAGEGMLDAHPVPGDLATEVVSRESAYRLRALLTRLPDAQREVITLAFYGQLTHAEIATELQLPAGTVKGRMRLGLHKLHAGIAKDIAWDTGRQSLAARVAAGKQP